MRIIKQNLVSFVIKGTTVLFLSFFVASCEGSKQVEAAIKQKNTTLLIKRFEQDFKASGVAGFELLRDHYPFFFPEQTPDSIWKSKFTNPIEMELIQAIEEQFGDFSLKAKELSHLYDHLNYYFPKKRPPTLYTLSAAPDAANKVIVNDSMWLLPLDNYLGPNHDFYKTFPTYLRETLDQKYLLIDLAAALSKDLVPKPAQEYLLSKMVYEGKKLLLQQLLWPHATEATHLHYSEAQFKWAVENEAQLWRYFMEKDYLYHTDTELDFRFLYPAPFSKFNLEIDRESPGRVGQFIGLQLAKAYYYKHNEDLEKMLNIDAVNLLKASSYKPKK